MHKVEAYIYKTRVTLQLVTVGKMYTPRTISSIWSTYFSAIRYDMKIHFIHYVWSEGLHLQDHSVPTAGNGGEDVYTQKYFIYMTFLVLGNQIW